MTAFTKGSRVHSGYGAYTDTSRCGTLLDSPGTMNAFVQWDGQAMGGLDPVASLRPASEPCAECRRVRRHAASCVIWMGLAHRHPYLAVGITLTGEQRPCRHCGRLQGHRFHGVEGKVDSACG